MFCTSCGGEYADWAQRCPYCGSVNEKADERIYLEHLEELKKRLDQVDEESEALYQGEIKRSVSTLTKRLAVIVIILAVLVTLITIISLHSDRKYEINRVAEQTWQREEEFPKLDAMYEAGEYDAILEECYSLLDRKDGFGIYNWRHFHFVCEAYCNYRQIDMYRFNFEATGEIDPYLLSCAIYASYYLMEEETDNFLDTLVTQDRQFHENGITEEDAEHIRAFRADAEAFLLEDLHFTPERIRDIRARVLHKEYDYVQLDKCNEVAEELIKEWTS